MTRLYLAAGVAAIILGLGYYAKVATERAALAEAAVEALAAGYEQYENRIAEANAALVRRDIEWKALEEDYEKQIREFNSTPVTECDLAPVDAGIAGGLLSAAGYSEGRGSDTGCTDGVSGPSCTPPYLSNRNQSEWIAGYQRQLGKCEGQLVEIKRLVEEARQ